jgi:hypothetical protein
VQRTSTARRLQDLELHLGSFVAALAKGVRADLQLSGLTGAGNGRIATRKIERSIHTVASEPAKEFVARIIYDDSVVRGRRRPAATSLIGMGTLVDQNQPRPTRVGNIKIGRRHETV